MKNQKIFESYRVTKSRGKIGSWSYYDAQNEVGDYLIKVSDELNIKGYGDVRGYIDEINKRGKSNKSIKVPQELKLKICVFDSRNSRIVLVYSDYSKIKSVQEVVNSKIQFKVRDTLWHLAMHLSHAEGWGDFGLADIWVDKHGKWWPDYLQLSKLTNKFGLDSLSSKKSVENFLKKTDRKKTNKLIIFFKHLTALINKNYICSGYIDFKGDKNDKKCDNYLIKLYSSILFKSKIGRSKSEDYDVLKNVSFKEKTQEIIMYEMLNRKTTIPHQMHNGYFWEAATITVSSSFRTGLNVTRPDTYSKIVTPYGLVINTVIRQCDLLLRDNPDVIQLV